MNQVDDSGKSVSETTAPVVDDPSKVQDSWLWIRDSRGYGSVSLTFVTVSFFATTVAYLCSLVNEIGPVSFRQFDVGACGAFFGTCAALYFGRKFTEAKFNTNSK